MVSTKIYCCTMHFNQSNQSCILEIRDLTLNTCDYYSGCVVVK